MTLAVTSARAAPTTSATPVIQVEHLVARYDERTVLEDVSFEVQRGERFLIVGPSGCGKTTLLRHLIGLQRPAAGRVRLDGEDLGRADPDQLRRLQRKFGVLFQSGALFASLTLGENISLLLEEYTTLPRETIDMLVRIKLSMVHLDGFQDFLISELSGGMKKRAGLARAMALYPSILFFDEPSAGLDPVTSAGLDELILQINRSLGTTIVAVSHELSSIFTIGERVIMLDGDAKGIIAAGAPAALRDGSADARVHAFFNRESATSVDGRRPHSGDRGA